MRVLPLVGVSATLRSPPSLCGDVEEPACTFSDRLKDDLQSLQGAVEHVLGTNLTSAEPMGKVVSRLMKARVRIHAVKGSLSKHAVFSSPCSKESVHVIKSKTLEFVFMFMHMCVCVCFIFVQKV